MSNFERDVQELVKMELGLFGGDSFDDPIEEEVNARFDDDISQEEMDAITREFYDGKDLEE